MAPAAEGRRRAKRVTDPLDDRVKAQLRGDEYRLGGYVSSGSEHEGAGELSGFIDGIFFSDEEEEDAAAGGVGSGEGGDEKVGSDAEEGWPQLSAGSTAAIVRDLLKPAVAGDPFRRELAAQVAELVERLAPLRPNRAAFRRALMGSLRESGYDAGICKARWESRGGASAGNYEYIDVLRPSSSTTPQRYLVDVEFAGEFEIARPSPEYERVAAQLPRVYVGRPEEMKRLLRLLADAAKRSLQSREMHIPPWRKGRYMQAKWLGAYRRTTNLTPAGSTAAPASHPSFTAGRDVKCRLVGFDAAPRLAVLPAATRAR
ncbi:unnamed protein product [Spirodela intermedia]|uniref:Uncharacterized protein n=2 Tax=Spirodela intermedia TaxID=51605 RepID=A0A7I8L445_SPIIN|nr:unnamed protein product [Spirodela intermedia]CAA6667939.1 unnamed protein product [Spirodela intermedia]CAA7404759.1 unnamed protein product [Spirodela intermedia]